MVIYYLTYFLEYVKYLYEKALFKTVRMVVPRYVLRGPQTLEIHVLKPIKTPEMSITFRGFDIFNKK